LTTPKKKSICKLDHKTPFIYSCIDTHRDFSEHVVIIGQFLCVSPGFITYDPDGGDKYENSFYKKNTVLDTIKY